MKTLKVLFFSILIVLQTFSGLALNNSADLRVGSCGHNHISIYYEFETDYLIACEGIIRAENFFSSYGYATETPISLYFSRRITIHDPILGHEPIYGYFNPKSMSVFMTSLTSPFVKNSERLYFRLELQPGFMLEEYHRSVVTHEIAHLFAQHNFSLRTGGGLEKPRMGHGVQEYIAYVVQLSSIDPTLLQQILRQYVPEIIFDDEQQINAILFACNPNKFAIMSYRHFHSLSTIEQKKILDRIFSYALHPDLVYGTDL